MKQNDNDRINALKTIFSKKLKELRQERQLSQRQMADKLGTAVSTYANWEQGRTEPGIYDIYNLLWVFDIDANELFDYDILN